MNKLYMNLSTKSQIIKPTKNDIKQNIIMPKIPLRNMLGRIQGVSRGCKACGK